MAATPDNRREQVTREDLILFINACFASTGQREFYETAGEQRLSLAFLHDYIAGNYRRLYARCLTAGINHFNQGEIILKLLATGKDTPPADRAEEGRLILSALHQLPTQRAWGLLRELQTRRINNRRSRAISRDYLAQRQNLPFEAIKYRSKLKAAIAHNHLNLSPLNSTANPAVTRATLPADLGPFLFDFGSQKHYQTPLFETFRKAHYSKEAVYQLPFTIAEGLATKHNIPRDQFLQRIQPQMTLGEKLRYQQTADRQGLQIALDWERLPLTKLALYILSLPIADRLAQGEVFHQALSRAARKVLTRSQSALKPQGPIAAILDNSYSSSGSSDKHRRPLGVALASHYLLQSLAEQSGQTYRVFWTTPCRDPLTVTARGGTDLATPILQSLTWISQLESNPVEATPGDTNPGVSNQLESIQTEVIRTGLTQPKPTPTIVILSDGHDNDPPGGAGEVLRLVRTRLDPTGTIAIVHCNPVFSAIDFTPKCLSPHIPTLGLRDGEDLMTVLAFARFANGGSLAELEAALAAPFAAPFALATPVQNALEQSP
jgi:hypothetical protein